MMWNGFQILAQASFLKFNLEFMINTAPQASNSMNGRKKYFMSVNFLLFIVQEKHGLVVWEQEVYHGISPSSVFLVPFFSVLSFFHHIFPWLVSLYSHWWPFTALQDFWDNIFLVLVILAFPWIVSGEANMLFLETPFKLLPDLLDPPPYKHCMYMYM